MKYHSVFDIIGPIMVGPSSSHTAGAARISKIARGLFGKQPKKATITLYGSFAKTYQGHGTDVAIVGGLLDFDTNDRRIIDSKVIAKDMGIDIKFVISDEETDHPNTARIFLEDENDQFEIVGVSVGGGKVKITEINGFKIRFSGNSPFMLVIHEDRFGVIASIANVLGLYKINIGYMEVARKEKGSLALMVMETDQPVDNKVIQDIKNLPYVKRVAILKIS
ncbi:L-serine dehydratase, iron-sulfur-dependent subunit beta [Vulcanibacillus modesticaldus]|uniref:L-serine deaminase n=1 Tax=Vulcanibacillus modesticaldus TaxID=337097 RepID=A0A1D2YXB4_9BACI|nr:L-serine ammonia-lyase, iron-sulfur-dependent subunit beta [Vulcanibacillus modesticaldus]OEG00342.1 L-serine dehydratase, iron-sulfur-dependent subunit beta [Vulcanibacillus modesticaldus]